MRVLDFGSINIDYVYQMDDFVKVKETKSCSHFERNIGGKGLNQAIACKKAGLDVYMAGCIGQDGLFILDYLKQQGIHTDFIQVVKEPTGHAIIQVCESENSIILYHGANHAITNDYIDDVFNHFNKDDILLIQNEISNLDAILNKAIKKQMKIYFNIAPYQDNVKSLPLNQIDTIFVNEIEGKQLSQCESDSYIDILEKLREMYSYPTLIMTVGKEGAYAYKDQILHQPSFPVTVIDSTAAGDTFTGYYIFSRFQNKTIQKAMEIASLASSITIQRKGAAKSVPEYKELEYD